MHLLHRLRAFLRLALGRNRAEQELDENLSSYLAMLTDEKIAAGMGPGEAARAARIELGGVEQVKEHVRDIRPAAWLETLVRDVRYALRGLRLHPGFTATVVITLAIAIGANTAIFTIVNAVALKPPPGIDDPGSLVYVTQGSGSDYVDVSYAVVDHLRRNARTVEDLAPALVMRFALGEPGEAPEVVSGLLVTGNYFSVLGVNGSMGRLFAPEESFYPAVGDSVVISHRYWQRRYHGHPGAMGETLMVNGTPLTVVGVTPPGFIGHMAALQNDVFVLIGTPAAGLPDAASLENAANNEFMAIGRLAEGASAAAASEELTALATEFAPQAGPRGMYEIRVEPYGPLPGAGRNAAFGLFAVLMTVVGLVLAIACVNVTSMLLSRAIERGREIAVRQALGAGRARLARQLLTESVVLFLLAAPIGMLLSIWATRLLWSLVPALPVSVGLDLSPDRTVLAFTLLVAAIAGVVSGLAPAL